MPVAHDNRKDFELPKSGVYVGTVADVVDLGKVKTQYGEKEKVRIVWLLNKVDSEGKPFRVMSETSLSMNEKATLFGIVKDILGATPPVPYEVEGLLGRSNQLAILQEKATNGNTYANVKAIMPLDGLAPVAIPTDFVRSKDKPAKTYTNNRQAAPAAQPAAQPTAAPAAAPVADEDIPF